MRGFGMLHPGARSRALVGGTLGRRPTGTASDTLSGAGATGSAALDSATGGTQPLPPLRRRLRRYFFGRRLERFHFLR